MMQGDKARERKLQEAQEDCDIAMASVNMQLIKVSGLRGHGEVTGCIKAIDRKCTSIEQMLKSWTACRAELA